MTANNKNRKHNFISVAGHAAAILIWLIIWHIAASKIDKEIFLPQPGRVFSVLFKELLPSHSFRASIIASLSHIGAGFFIGAVTGILLAGASYLCSSIKILLWFPMKVLKSIPVASFVILTLLWMDSDGLSVFIPAIVVLPTLYINTLTGLMETDKKLLDMAKLFRISGMRKITYIYIPSILPYILSASSLAIGMAWKSGIAAEIIGLAKNTVGNELYKAKIYLQTPQLFAWTIVIVALSVVCESAIKLLAGFINRKEAS